MATCGEGSRRGSPWVKILFDMVCQDLAHRARVRLVSPADHQIAHDALDAKLGLFLRSYFDSLEFFDLWVRDTISDRHAWKARFDRNRENAGWPYKYNHGQLASGLSRYHARQGHPTNPHPAWVRSASELSAEWNLDQPLSRMEIDFIRRHSA
jgi:hypothetical protein